MPYGYYFKMLVLVYRLSMAVIKLTLTSAAHVLRMLRSPHAGASLIVVHAIVLHY